jgi:hypothetical protein
MIGKLPICCRWAPTADDDGLDDDELEVLHRVSLLTVPPSNRVPNWPLTAGACHGVWLRIIALRIVSILRMQAMSATLCGLPAAHSRW